MLLDHLEQAINDVSDKDWSWWPFLWLRPKQDAPLSLARLTAIAALYGVPSAIAFGLGLALALPAAPAHDAMAGVLLGVPLFFLFLSSAIVGPMWNRRAERLRVRVRS